jgi:hypothetical protein
MGSFLNPLCFSRVSKTPLQDLFRASNKEKISRMIFIYSEKLTYHCTRPKIC